MADSETIKALQAALAVSPENGPLRQHLAASLMQLGRYEEAEAEYRICLKQAPDDRDLRFELADCFKRQDKGSAAMVILEDLTQGSRVHPRACVLYARLLVQSGEVEQAVQVYRAGIEADPEVADPVLADTLGVRPQSAPANASWQDSHEVVDGRVRGAMEAPPEAPVADVERPKVNFADVGGMADLKEDIRMKIIAPLEHPEIYAAYGKKMGGGILMYGPPGCGKTHLARATAGEIRGNFVSVGIDDVLDMWIGNSERNLHGLFETARQNTPCVLFFDEVDALGANRADMRQSGGRHLINQFLAELDGVEANNEGVLVLAATNAPWHLDPAFRRPGRFDQVIFVPPPDRPARADILRLLLASKPTDGVDVDKLAAKTEGFSGADLKGMVDQAIEGKLAEAMRTGRPVPLTTKDLLAAAKKAHGSTKEWFATAKNYALYANQGGIYDDIVRYMKLG